MSSPLNGPGIYEILNLKNGRRYIGSASVIRTRWSVHRHMLRKGVHHSRYLQRAWDKYGKEAFEFRVLLYCAVDKLEFFEQHCFDAFSPEYNAAKRAGRGGGISEEGRKKLSQRMRGNKNTLGLSHKPESMAILSKALRGRKAHNKGKKQTAEHIAKRMKAHIGAKRSAETRKKIGDAHRGKKRKPYTAETRRKLSEAIRGTGRLSEDDIRLIRKRCANGESHQRVSNDFPVSRSMVSAIVKRLRYQWVR